MDVKKILCHLQIDEYYKIETLVPGTNVSKVSYNLKMGKLTIKDLKKGKTTVTLTTKAKNKKEEENQEDHKDHCKESFFKNNIK